MQHSDTHTRLYTKPIIEINPYSLSYTHKQRTINASRAYAHTSMKVLEILAL